MDTKQITVQDVIDNYAAVKTEAAENTASLLKSLQEVDINNLNDEQVDNVQNFVSDAPINERKEYILFILDNQDITQQINKNTQRLLSPFRSELESFMEEGNSATV